MIGLTRPQTHRLLRYYWSVVAALICFALLSARELSAQNAFLAFAIGFFALLPIYLWCAGYAPGLPIFPMLALTYLWAFALPNLTHSELAQVAFEARLFA